MPPYRAWAWECGQSPLSLMSVLGIRGYRSREGVDGIETRVNEAGLHGPGSALLMGCASTAHEQCPSSPRIIALHLPSCVRRLFDYVQSLAEHMSKAALVVSHAGVGLSLLLHVARTCVVAVAVVWGWEDGV